jgi:excisionase family DNA binding protein
MSAERAYDQKQRQASSLICSGPVVLPKNQTRPTTAANAVSGRISIPEIAKRLSIGRLAVYAMLEQGMLPGIRLCRRWIVTRHAYEQWERTCGTTGFQRQVGGNV